MGEDHTTAGAEAFASAGARSAGVLSEAERLRLRALGIALAYDPVQVGWVRLDGVDDLAPLDTDGDEVGPPRPGRSAAWRGRLEGLKAAYRLRPWREDDVGTFVALLDDPEVWRHLPETYPAPLTEDLARDLIRLSDASEHHDVFAVEWGGGVIGQVRLAFDVASRDRREGEISYWLGRSHWGRGLGGDLVALFTHESFRRRPDLGTIVARVHEENRASARVLEKASYRRRGKASDDPSIDVHRVSREDYGFGPAPARPS